MAGEWWADELKPELSKGDVVASLPFWVPLNDLQCVEKKALPAPRPPAWLETKGLVPDAQGFFYFIARGRIAPGIILSHDCELDKARRNRRVQVALLADPEKLSSEERQAVLGQGKWAHLVLPSIPELGTFYADLLIQVTLDRKVIDGRKRIASMSDLGAERLRAQIVAYFTRLEEDNDLP